MDSLFATLTMAAKLIYATILATTTTYVVCSQSVERFGVTIGHPWAPMDTSAP
ncbi:MAG: hypothetical protein K0U36_05780 [Alphaproteobacteria bacterium]|nr:hypothetical protein [Alphaproteobacteria bacterium]